MKLVRIILSSGEDIIINPSQVAWIAQQNNDFGTGPSKKRCWVGMGGCFTEKEWLGFLVEGTAEEIISKLGLYLS